MSERERLPTEILQHVQETALLRAAADKDLSHRVPLLRQQDHRRELHVDQKLCLYRVQLRQQQGRRLTFTVGYSKIKQGVQL